MLQLNFADFMEQFKFARRKDRPTMHYRETDTDFTMYFNYLGEWKYFSVVEKDTIEEFGAMYNQEREESIDDWKMEYLKDAIKLADWDFDTYVGDPLPVTKKSFVKEADIRGEAKTYENFFTQLLDKWKEEALRNLPELELRNKSFTTFLTNMLNTVNTLPFINVVRRFVKDGMQEGIDTVEEETGQQIGFTLSMDSRLTSLESEQLNGYRMLNGEVWHGIKGATKNLQNDIFREMEESVQNKETRKEATERIKKIFDVSKSRAETIARTETNRFINEGKQAAYTEIGMRFKYPSVNTALKNSDLCLRLEARYKEDPVPTTSAYTDEVTGQSFMHPPHHPNCGCVLQGKMTKD